MAACDLPETNGIANSSKGNVLFGCYIFNINSEFKQETKQGFEKHQHLSSSLQLFPYVNKKGKTAIGPCGKKLAKEMNICAHARLLSCI